MASEKETEKDPRDLMRELRSALWKKKFKVPGTDLFLAPEAAMSENCQLEVFGDDGLAVGYLGRVGGTKDRLYLCDASHQAPETLWEEKIPKMRSTKDLLRLLSTIVCRHEYLLVPGKAEAGDSWHETAARNGIALALVVCPATKRWLMHLRSDRVLHPRTWGLPGGAIENAELPAQAAERELAEEAGIYNAKYVDIVNLDSKLHLVLFKVEQESRTKKSDEVLKSAWVSDFPEPLIPAMRPVLEQYKSAIARVCEESQAHSLADFSPKFRSWFGKSVTLGPDGLPQKFYHGTNYSFDAFSKKFLGRGTDQHGIGFYFSTDPAAASGYTDPKPYIDAPAGAPSIYPVYLRITKPVTHRPLTKAQLSALISFGNEDDLWNFGDVGYEGRAAVIRAAVSIYEEAGDTPRVLMSISNDLYKGAEDKFVDVVTRVTGYDGMLVRHQGSTLAVVFHPNQIKSVFNKNPTLSSDAITASTENDFEHKTIRTRGKAFSMLNCGPDSTIVAFDGQARSWASFSFDESSVTLEAVASEDAVFRPQQSSRPWSGSPENLATAAADALDDALRDGTTATADHHQNSSCVEYVFQHRDCDRSRPCVTVDRKLGDTHVIVSVAANGSDRAPLLEAAVHVRGPGTEATVRFHVQQHGDVLRAQTHEITINEQSRPFTDVVVAGDSFPKLVNALVTYALSRAKKAASAVNAAAEQQTPAAREEVFNVLHKFQERNINGFEVDVVRFGANPDVRRIVLFERIGRGLLEFVFRVLLTTGESPRFLVYLSGVVNSIAEKTAQRKDEIYVPAEGTPESVAKLIMAKAVKLAQLAKIDMNLKVIDGHLIDPLRKCSSASFFNYVVQERSPDTARSEKYVLVAHAFPDYVKVRDTEADEEFLIGFKESGLYMHPFLGRLNRFSDKMLHELREPDTSISVRMLNSDGITDRVYAAALEYVKSLGGQATAAAELEARYRLSSIFTSKIPHKIFPLHFSNGGDTYNVRIREAMGTPILYVDKNGVKDEFSLALSRRTGLVTVARPRTDMDFRTYTPTVSGSDIRKVVVAELLKIVKTFYDLPEATAAAEPASEIYDFNYAVFNVTRKEDFEFSAAGHRIKIQQGLTSRLCSVLVDGVQKFMFITVENPIEGKRYAIARRVDSANIGPVHRFNVNATSSNPRALVTQVFKKMLESRAWQEKLEWTP